MLGPASSRSPDSPPSCDTRPNATGSSASNGSQVPFPLLREQAFEIHRARSSCLNSTACRCRSSRFEYSLVCQDARAG